jgi:hypothetical protein
MEDNKTDVLLKEYITISKFIKKEKDDEPKTYLLPTPESLDKLCSPQIVKDVLTFNLKKYQTYFEIKKDNDSDEEINIMNLDKLSSIKNNNLIPYILLFIGGINSANSLYDFFKDETTNFNDDCLIDKSPNYFIYLNSTLDFLKVNDLISVPFSEMNSLFEILDELGIKIKKEDNNVLYRNIKDSFLSMEKNRILILIAPSNNFWIKSEKKTINEQNYDIRLNNYSNIFYNKKFIHKFLLKVLKHPRCSFGLLSSMSYKNLKNCWDGLEKQFSPDCPKKIIFIDQKVHKEITLPNSKKKTFYRCMESIKNYLKNTIKKKDKDKNKDEDEDEEKEKEENTGLFNERNILILESEDEKMTDDTRHNSIYVNLFNEDYLEKNEKEKSSIDLEGDKVINYVVKLLDNCTDDIREYINHNKISNEYSKV